GRVAARAGAAERGPVPADAERLAQVPGERPDIGTARAGHGHVDVQQVTGAPLGNYAERPYGHRPGREWWLLARPGHPVGSFPVHLDGADGWRDLLDLAGQLLRRGPDRREGHP